MARFVKGEMVVLPFPFSDLTQAKRRPALVVAVLPGDDLIVCQITSQPSRSPHAIPLHQADFSAGGLNRSSFLRPERLFTADAGIVFYGAGIVATPKLQAVIAAIIAILQKP